MEGSDDDDLPEWVKELPHMKEPNVPTEPLLQPKAPPLEFYLGLRDIMARSDDPKDRQMAAEHPLMPKIDQYVAEQAYRAACGDPNARPITPMPEAEVQKVIDEHAVYYNALFDKIMGMGKDTGNGVTLRTDGVDFSQPPPQAPEPTDEEVEQLLREYRGVPTDKIFPGYAYARDHPNVQPPPLEFDMHDIRRSDPYLAAVPDEIAYHILEKVARRVGPVRKWAVNDTRGPRYCGSVYFTDPMFTDGYVPSQGTKEEFGGQTTFRAPTWEEQIELSGGMVLGEERIRAACEWTRRYYPDFGREDGAATADPLGSSRWFFETLRDCQPRCGSIFLHFGCGDGRWVYAAIAAFDFLLGRGIVDVPQDQIESTEADRLVAAIRPIGERIDKETGAKAAELSAEFQRRARVATPTDKYRNMAANPLAGEKQQEEEETPRRFHTDKGDSIKITPVMFESNGLMLFDADILLCQSLDDIDFARVRIGCKLICRNNRYGAEAARSTRRIARYVYFRIDETYPREDA
eukprot:ctg_1755.g492